MLESTIVFLSLIFTYDLFAQKAESAVNEHQLVLQKNNCDTTSRCIIVGENNILINMRSLGPIEGNIIQTLREENNCTDNSTCAHFGEEPFIPGNKMSLGINSSGGISMLSDLSINSEQELDHVNTCTNMRGIIIESEFGTIISGCLTQDRNLVQIGHSDSAGSLSSITNVTADTKQNIDTSQECTNGSEFAICGIIDTNNIEFGSATFGGTSNIASMAFKSDQKINTELNCNDRDNVDLFCVGDAANTILIGNSGESTSNILNVRMDSDQEINQLVKCEQMLGFCQMNTGNGIGLEALINGDIVSEQKLDNELKCNDKSNTFCETGAVNRLLVGVAELPGVSSTVSNLELNLGQVQDQKLDCAEANTFASCENGGINLVEIGLIKELFEGGGTDIVNSLDANIRQLVDVNSECSDASIFGCSNLALNEIFVGNLAGGGVISNLTNIDLDLSQIAFVENKCGGGTSFGCSNSIVSNALSIGGGGSATVAKSVVVSDLDANIKQHIMSTNECSVDTICTNLVGGNTGRANNIDIATASDIFRCCFVEANSAMSVQDLNADIKQTVIQNNQCTDNSLLSPDIGGTCSNSAGIVNLVSIGSTSTLFGFSEPFAASIDVSNIDTKIAQIVEQNNNCHDNAVCLGNSAGNTVRIGTFSAFDALGDETEVTVTLSEIIADANQEVKQESNCSNILVFPGCENTGSNQISIGSPDAFGSNVDISKISLVAEETLLQENGCKNNVLCSNNAENLISIGSGSSLPGLEKLSNVRHDSHQEIVQANKCENGDGETACKTDGQNLVNIEGNMESDPVTPSADTAISVLSTQNIDQLNRCKTGSDCNKEAVNSANITQTGISSTTTTSSEEKERSTNRVTLHQLSEQNDNCSLDSTCIDSSSNSATFDVGEYEGDGKIEQQIEQGNHCLIGSTCGNDGSTSATIEDRTPADQIQVKQSIDQQNLCIRDSACSNTGLVAEGSGSNIQSNTCVGDSTCNNSGENNKTICVRSADCENTGTDTKVISKGQDCSSGGPGSTTVCANGRTITH